MEQILGDFTVALFSFFHVYDHTAVYEQEYSKVIWT